MRAFVVWGPEGSGTRLLTRILMRMGCHGSDKHDQPFDEYIPDGMTPIVWRRSIPHRGALPDLPQMIVELRLRGYVAHAVIPARDWGPTGRSQIANKHVSYAETARGNIRGAYLRIFQAIAITDTKYTMVTYQGLVNYPHEVIGWLTRELGLSMPDNIPIIYDADERRWLECH